MCVELIIQSRWMLKIIPLLFAELLVKRHYGVLGLSALIEACPYSVPEWLPEVIEHVASHNHDPAPIRVSG